MFQFKKAVLQQNHLLPDRTNDGKGDSKEALLLGRTQGKKGAELTQGKLTESSVAYTPSAHTNCPSTSHTPQTEGPKITLATATAR